MSGTVSARERIAHLLNASGPTPRTAKKVDDSRRLAQAVADRVDVKRVHLEAAEADLATLQQELVVARALAQEPPAAPPAPPPAPPPADQVIDEAVLADGPPVVGVDEAPDGDQAAAEELAQLERKVAEAQQALADRKAEAESAVQAEEVVVDVAAQAAADVLDDEDQSDQAADEARKEIARLRAANDEQLEKLGFWAFVGLTVVSGVLVVAKLPKPKTWNSPDEWSVATLTPDVSAALTALTGWLLVGALIVLTKQSGGLRGVLIGKDGRFSTSIVQSVVWTAALFYALLFLTLRTAADGCGTGCTSPFEDLDAAYLVLLGGPFAAAAAARASIGAKVEAGTVQSVPAESTAVKDLVTDDDGNADLVDIQFLAFNVIALAYFVVGLVGGPTKELPALPAGLVALTSLGALTYATNKAIARNAPVITSVVRARGKGPIRPGDVVEVRGVNLVPEGASEVEQLALIKVRFDEVAASLVADVKVKTPTKDTWGPSVIRGAKRTTKATGVASTAVRARVPWGLAADTYDVTLVTAAGVTTEPVQVQVGEDVPVVLAVRPERLRPGGTAQVVGRAFRSAGTPGQVFVSFDGRNVAAEPVSTSPGGVERVRVPVPAHLVGPQVAVGVVATSGEASETIPVEVKVEPVPGA